MPLSTGATRFVLELAAMLPDNFNPWWSGWQDENQQNSGRFSVMHRAGCRQTAGRVHVMQHRPAATTEGDAACSHGRVVLQLQHPLQQRRIVRCQPAEAEAGQTPSLA